jgi:hypothetical protein
MAGRKDISRYKVLDGDDTSLWTLPDGAFKLYMFYRLRGDEQDESFYSLRSISAMLGQDKNTVHKWQAYLLAHGWIGKTGETAADRYSQPTPSSHQVPVIKCMNNSDTELPSNDGEAPLSENFMQSTVGNSHTKVSCSSSGSASSCHSSFASQAFSDSEMPAGQPDPLEEKLKPKPKPKTAPDGVPYPDGFDSWENQGRLDWLAQHGLKVGSLPKIKGTLEYDRAMRDAEERHRQEFDEELCREPEEYRPPWERDGSSEPRQENNPKPKAKYFPDPCVNCGMDEGYGRFGLCARCQTDDAAMRKAEEGVFIPRCAHTSGGRRCCNDAVDGTFCSEHKNKEQRTTDRFASCPTCGGRLRTRDGRTYCTCIKNASPA